MPGKFQHILISGTITAELPSAGCQQAVDNLLKAIASSTSLLNQGVYVYANLTFGRMILYRSSSFVRLYIHIDTWHISVLTRGICVIFLLMVAILFRFWSWLFLVQMLFRAVTEKVFNWFAVQQFFRELRKFSVNTKIKWIMYFWTYTSCTN
jgi:hypothetical protein